MCTDVIYFSGCFQLQYAGSISVPRTPAELAYDELMNTFEVHLCTKKNVLVSQHHFLSAYQAETQTITDYIATPRRDIID
jgi:hypothetical protein